jgi:hypothetical protein
MMRLRLAVVGLCLLMTGCRHRTPVVPVIPPPAPVAVTNDATPKTPPLLPSETPPPAPMATVPVVPAAPAKKAKKTKPTAATAAPNEVATATPPSVAIGSLSEDGESISQSRKSVAELIAANAKRLGALSADVKDKEKDQIVRVQNFQADAQKALSSGETEGALTLATKAKVLLDEIAK